MQFCVLVETAVEEDPALEDDTTALDVATLDELADTDELEISTYVNEELDGAADEDTAVLDVATLDELADTDELEDVKDELEACVLDDNSELEAFVLESPLNHEAMSARVLGSVTPEWSVHEHSITPRDSEARIETGLRLV